MKTSYFANKIVWIIGASSGIGEALAYTFAKQNACLVLSARRKNELERVKKQCNLPDNNILVLPIDLHLPSDYAQEVELVLKHFGKIDILIHSAGISQRASFSEIQPNVFRDIFEVNFFSIVMLTKAVLPAMKARKTGNIVAISSVAGKFGTPMRSAYVASKHAVIGFCSALRTEVWTENISVLAVCPGYVRTNLGIYALKADGTPQGNLDANHLRGLAPTLVAEKIRNAIQQNKNEIVIAGLKEKIALWLHRFFPDLLAKLVRNVNR